MDSTSTSAYLSAVQYNGSRMPASLSLDDFSKSLGVVLAMIFPSLKEELYQTYHLMILLIDVRQ